MRAFQKMAFLRSLQGASDGVPYSGSILLEGDMQSGADNLLLEGDEQSGSDVLLYTETI